MRAKGKRNFLVKVKSRKTKKTNKYEVKNKLTFAEAASEAYKIHNSLVYGAQDDGPWYIVSISEQEVPSAP